MKNHSSLLIFLILVLVGSSKSAPSPKRFNINAFGARGDGRSDSTEAFSAAWKAACGSAAAAEVYVPKGKYLMQPVKLEGPCSCPQLTVRIDGSLEEPADYMAIAEATRWIEFSGVDNVVIQGGTLLGHGESLWNCKHPHCPSGGRTLRISQSTNVWINNITSINSQGFHISIGASQNINVFGATIVAPEDSPNTDGIHVENTTGLTITSSNFQTGDDCISLGQGSQNVWIQNVWCGPGHGISIGSLANNPGELGVRNVTVKDVNFNGTQNGFRIKTWAKPLTATVNDVHFVNAVMDDVKNPILIDQFYCPDGVCHPQESYAKISNVEFSNINGTSASDVAIKFNCNPKFPCTGLSMQDVMLKHQPTPAQSEVKNAVVHTAGVVEPNVGST